jgi:hypothetical protein
MKKLLVLLLVLGMASLANAALVLSINGEEAPGEITLMTSETIVIDMHLTAGQTNFAYDVAFVLSNAQAALDWSEITFPTEYFFAGALIGQPNPQEVRVSASQFMAGTDIVGPAVLVDGLLLHCEEATPLRLDLIVMDGAGTVIDGQAQVTGTILDSVTIMQIPEPASMLLLGLGGLLLRRRK